MSNYYAKAINPRTNKLEKAVVLDMGKDNFIQFEDGWKHNLKFFKGDVITEDEQEAINQDGEEVIKYFGDAISPSEASMYFLAGLFAMIPIVYGIVTCVKLIWNWIKPVV